MPQLDFDGANSKVSADKIQGQSGTTVTVPTGHKIAGTDANSITINGVNAVAVAPSTSGNVLTSTGSAWASSAAAGGAWAVRGSEVSFSGVSQIVIGSLTKTTRIIFKSVTMSVDGSYIQLVLSPDSGSSYSATGYNFYVRGWDSVNSALHNYGNPDTKFIGSSRYGNATGENGWFDVTIFDPQVTKFTHLKSDGHSNEQLGRLFIREGGCVHNVASVVTDIKFTPYSSGTMSGTYLILELN